MISLSSLNRPHYSSLEALLTGIQHVQRPIQIPVDIPSRLCTFLCLWISEIKESGLRQLGSPHTNPKQDCLARALYRTLYFGPNLYRISNFSLGFDVMFYVV